MSCFMLSDKHFWYMAKATAAFARSQETRSIFQFEMQQIARTLKQQNAQSVADRYPRDRKPCPSCGLEVCHPLSDCPFAAVAESATGAIDPVTVLKAVACYEYQACEAKHWDTSQAKGYCDTLRNMAISALPGYQEAPWGIE